jgi:DNA polymerase-3 subunit gamma/tau
MGQALYRAYRPKSLDEIVGQEHITSTLSKALKSGRISHAYLFSGPRGVGKTSIARILAHQLNGLPYTDDSAHLDIIEIDAASNRRIDEIRDLRDKVYIAPSSGKYKVYIIDEVHMLTREAFNALLKTLEEPPEHAIFILATTEAHKLPETIISRTQHYTFKPVERAKVVTHLSDIAKKEKIVITREALELLADHGEGSFRDSISLLDQAGSSGVKVDEQAVRQLLGIAPEAAIDGLIAALRSGGTTVLKQLGDLYSGGLQAASIASQLAAKIRLGLSAGKPVLSVPVSLRLLRELIEVPASHNPERLLEIILLEASELPDMAPVATVVAVTPPTATPKAETEQPESAPKQQKASASPTPKAAQPAKPIGQTNEPEVRAKPEPAKAEKEAANPTIPSSIKALDAALWPQVLDGLKKQYNTLYGVLRMANPVFGEDSLELQLKFAFHQKRLNEAKNRKIIADFIKQVTGKDITILCTVNSGATPASPVAPAAPAAIASVTDIFGGGEVIN